MALTARSILAAFGARFARSAVFVAMAATLLIGDLPGAPVGSAAGRVPPSLPISEPAKSANTDARKIAAVQEHLRTTYSMKADFVQTDSNGQQLTGELTLKRPGKIRFQYQKDVPLLIIGNESALTLIDYEVAQVQRWPIKNSPLGVLLDPERDFAHYAKVIPTGNHNVTSIAVKDPKKPEFGTITLVFTHDLRAPAGLRLRGWIALDAQHNRTRIDLINQRFNIAVADSTFKWTDPRRRKRIK